MFTEKSDFQFTKNQYRGWILPKKRGGGWGEERLGQFAERGEWRF